MRITASWFGSQDTHRIQACGAIRAPTKRAPLDSVIPTTPSVPSCSEPSRYGLAMMEPAATLVRRLTLTAPARDSVCGLWVGTKKRAPDRTKKLTKKKDKPLRTGLTKKA